jgi:hypothetical protein
MNGTDFQTVPSISLVTPNRIIVGRTLEVAISGFGTKWTSAARVAFGAGITVANVRVASPTALLADVTVASDAALGTRDVTVTEGTAVASYVGVFTVQPVYTVRLPAKATRGAVFAIVIHNNDPVFAVTGTPTATLSPPPTSDDVRTFVSSPTAQDLVVQVFADLTAPLGKRTVQVVANEGVRNEFKVELADAFDLAEKAELPLVDGTPVTGTLAEPYSGVLFKYVPTASELRKFSFDTTAAGKPFIFLLGSTGVYADRLTEGTGVLGLCPPEGCYVSAFDTSGKEGLTYEMSVAAPPGGPEVEPNDSIATAQAVTLVTQANVPQAYMSGQLSALTDQDWFKITVTAADVGKHVHVVTSPGDQTTDTIVDVQTAAGMSLGGPSSDSGLHEDFTSTPILAAGDYFVQVANSPDRFSYDVTRSRYVAAITLE